MKTKPGKPGKPPKLQKPKLSTSASKSQERYDKDPQITHNL